MSGRLDLALAALNPHLGALPGNAARILAARADAASRGAQLLLTPHASLCGHPVRDLARDAGFRAACDVALASLAAATADGGPALLVGAPVLEAGAPQDATFLLGEGRILARRARHAVPERDGPFQPGPAPGPVAFRGIRLGLMTGADLADPSVAETLAESGAELLLCPGATPAGPADAVPEIDLAVARVVETGLPLAWVGQWGGQEEDVYAGGGFVLNADRSLALRLPGMGDALAVTAWQRDGEEGWLCTPQPLPTAVGGQERLWRLLALGLADHVAKNGFAGAAVPLAGGPGPILVLALAADALGPGRVRALVPEDAAPDPAIRLGVAWQRVPAIAVPGCESPEATCRLSDAVMLSLAEGRGDVLLPGFDRTAWLLGEASTPGGFAPLKGLYASEAHALARWRGLDVAAAPGSATDTILEALADRGQTVSALAAQGFDPAMASTLWRRMHRGGYKRQQASPGMTLGRWRDRHAPLTHGFTDPAS